MTSVETLCLSVFRYFQKGCDTGEKQAKIKEESTVFLVLYKGNEKSEKMGDGAVTSIYKKKNNIIVFGGRTAHLTLLFKVLKIRAFTKAKGTSIITS